MLSPDLVAASALAETQLTEARRVATILQGFTTPEACDLAEAAILRMPTKAQMRLAIRAARREAVQAKRADADPFAIPPMPVHA